MGRRVQRTLNVTLNRLATGERGERGYSPLRRFTRTRGTGVAADVTRTLDRHRRRRDRRIECGRGGLAADGSVELRPVPSLTPAATQRLWRELVRRPRVHSLGTAACSPLRAVFYSPTDWRRLATRLAATASPCAQYYISVPPLVADKTQLRADEAWRIRALGPAFHALAEINVTGWTSWVASQGGRGTRQGSRRGGAWPLPATTSPPATRGR